MSSTDDYAARHAQLVFTLLEGQLHVNFTGYGKWGENGVFPEQRSFSPLTKEATSALIDYLKRHHE